MAILNLVLYHQLFHFMPLTIYMTTDLLSPSGPVPSTMLFLFAVLAFRPLY